MSNTDNVVPFKQTKILVDVVYNEHANLDSLPLRYGIHYSKTKRGLELHDCEIIEDFGMKIKKLMKKVSLFLLKVQNLIIQRLLLFGGTIQMMSIIYQIY